MLVLDEVGVKKLETKEDKTETCRGPEHLRSISRQMFISNLSSKSCEEKPSGGEEENQRYQIQQPVQELAAPSPPRNEAQQISGPTTNMYNNFSFGACQTPNCACDVYVRPHSQSLIRCEACDHAPFKHTKLN
jgi:hypothetical protein